MKLVTVSFLLFLSISCLAQDTPSVAELSWLRSQIIPLKTCDMNAEDSDLMPLHNLIENAQVVALGEVTHGSSEIYKMKDRIIKYLVEKEGFDVFAIEANMPEAYRLNEYIIEGKGDPKELIRGMYFWTWRTQEMLDLVNWMKAYNDRHTKKVKFTGFDMQFYQGPYEEIHKIYLKYGSNDTSCLAYLRFQLVNLFKRRMKDVAKTGEASNYAGKTYFKHELQNLKIFAQEKIFDTAERTWFLQNITLLSQYVAKQDFLHRDKCMAENFFWIRDHNPGSRFIIWAHNAHIQKGNGSTYWTQAAPMGSYLSRKLKENYLVIGFTFYKGSYTATGKNKLTTYQAQTAYPGTYEYCFHQIGLNYFLLKFDPSKTVWNQWLYNRHLFRETGAEQMDNEFEKHNLTRSFDAIIFIDSSSASTLLPRN